MSLQAKTFEEARTRFRPMRRTPMKAASAPMKRTRMKKAGKKVKQWESIRAKLKKAFAAVGITTCELFGKLPHLCWRDDYLGFAHNAKRRKLSEDDLYHVILICNRAHDIIEVWAPQEMKRIVDSTIYARSVQPQMEKQQ